MRFQLPTVGAVLAAPFPETIGHAAGQPLEPIVVDRSNPSLGHVLVRSRWLASLLIVGQLCAVPAVHAQSQAWALVDAPIYLEPNTSRQPIRIAPQGTRLSVLRIEDEWVIVEFRDPYFDQRVGYVHKSFLRLFELPPEPAPGPLPPSASPTPTTQSMPTRPQPRVSGEESERQIGTAGNSVKDVRIRGYVTNVLSATSFEIGDYRITRDQGFVLDLQNAADDLTFNFKDIRIGVELEIRGFLNERSGELRAKSIKVDMEQFRSIRQTAIISRPPEGIAHTGNGWTGQFVADGQRISVTPTTQVLFKTTERERKAVEQQARADRRGESLEEDEGEVAILAPLSSLDQVMTGMAMTYEGRRRPEDGVIIAEKVEFSRNDLEEGEAKLWQSLETSPNTAQALQPGELRIEHVGKFKLLQNDQVQEYVRGIGRRLIPPYQISLPDSDPQKIPFRFYVVSDKLANAFALPNGIVVVNTGLIELLENEAQLAAVLGHEIAHATQEHAWRQREYHRKKRFILAVGGAVTYGYGLYSLADLANLVEGAIKNGHSRSLENQADRVGLESMVQAGYDPREAPRVWKLMTKQSGLQLTNVFWSTHENHATRRSYLMNELKNNYRDLDYSRLETEGERFVRMQEALKESVSEKGRVAIR